MSKKIKIDGISPEPSDGDDLKNYYFQEENGTLNFYSPTNVELWTNVILNVPFTVEIGSPPLMFQITVTAYTKDVSASGGWSDYPPHASDVAVGDSESGSFTAQAGITPDDPVSDEEAASSANA